MTVIMQINAMLGGVWADQSASAFGLFKFVQSLASMVAFCYSAYLPLPAQLLIAALGAVLGTTAAVWLELDTRAESKLVESSKAGEGNQAMKYVNEAFE